LRRILLPHHVPAFAAASVIAVFRSIRTVNVTLFTKANAATLTVEVFSQVRSGITSKNTALAVLPSLLTSGLARICEMNRRRRAEDAMLGQPARRAPSSSPRGAFGEE